MLQYAKLFQGGVHEEQSSEKRTKEASLLGRTYPVLGTERAKPGGILHRKIPCALDIRILGCANLKLTSKAG